jgi:hypothetical protein
MSIWFHTRAGTGEMWAFGPAPTACGWSGRLIRGFGAALGSWTGMPGGRLLIRWRLLVSPKTQSSRRTWARHMVSVRGRIVIWARPSEPVRNLRTSRQ